MAEVFKVVYREFKKAGGGGADGHVVGLNGSINPRCVEIVLTWMEVNGKAVLDFGCASGEFLVCASLAGAHRAIGVELPDNKAQKYIFDAACKRIEQALSVHLHDLEWNAQDINQVLEN
jgi:predicted RNA methylase